MDDKVYVMGHKNPDSDSICSAISYARLKSIMTGKQYVPMRTGEVNDETNYILNKFGFKAPDLVTDVRPQVSDVERHMIPGVDESTSVKSAWKLMKENHTETLPIVKNGVLNGIVTIGDISRSYFEVYDSNILAEAKTKLTNVIDALEAKVVVGNTDQIIQEGKVVIAAASPDLMEQYIDKDDIVILGNRYEAQLCAIEMGARCIVICEGAAVTKTICMMAEKLNCVIIITEYDTFTVSRLINQSMPVSFYMTLKNKIIEFDLNDYVEDIREIMAKKRYRHFPIHDENGLYIGMISRRNLLKHGRKKIILVDHNEKSQAVNGVETAQIKEIIDHHRIGSLETISPVYFRNQPLGCTATIIYQMYEEAGLVPEKDIAALLCCAIISDTLILKSPTCTAIDTKVCNILADIAGIDIENFGKEMFKAGSNISNKTPQELYKQDFKRFSVNNVNIGVGQINYMVDEEIKDIKQPMIDYIEKSIDESEIDMAFFMMTNVMNSTTELICAGRNAYETIKTAFGVKGDDKIIILEGVVSRKKQLLPAIMEVLQ